VRRNTAGDVDAETDSAVYVPLGTRILRRMRVSGRFPPPDICDGGKMRLWTQETIET